jgi:hypothetical protein
MIVMEFIFFQINECVLEMKGKKTSCEVEEDNG